MLAGLFLLGFVELFNHTLVSDNMRIGTLFQRLLFLFLTTTSENDDRRRRRRCAHLAEREEDEGQAAAGFLGTTGIVFF